MAADNAITAKVNDEELEKIDRMQMLLGKDTRSKTIREMVNIAHREYADPLVYRLKDLSLRLAWQLLVFALLALLFGFMSTVLSPRQGMVMAAGLTITAAAILAVVEAMRAAKGQSEVGAMLREVGR